MWFKVDDKLHDHRKSRKAGKAAMGVWVLAGSWSMDHETDGFVPDDVLLRWGTKSDAAALVRAGLWFVDTHHDEKGWRFHDWSRFQPPAAVTAANRAAKSEAGARGNHRRWHADRGISDPHCEYCFHIAEPSHPATPERSQPESDPIPPVPVPDPTTTSNEVVGVSEPRDDVERICEYLAAAVEENGSKRPVITKGWRDDARRLLDLDMRTEAEVIRAIDWCQRGTSDRARFWRPNVMSMSKLRAKFDQMRLQAAEEVRASAPKPTRTQEHLALAQQLAAQEPPEYVRGELA